MHFGGSAAQHRDVRQATTTSRCSLCLRASVVRSVSVSSVPSVPSVPSVMKQFTEPAGDANHPARPDGAPRFSDVTHILL